MLAINQTRGTTLPDGSVAQGNLAGTSLGSIGSPIWRWRSVAALHWSRGVWDATLTARYFSPILEDCTVVTDTADGAGDPSLRELCSDPDHMEGGDAAPRNRVASVTYFDIEAGWNAPWKARVAIGVRNAFDRNPPVAFSAMNSFFSSYDVPGRFWYASYQQKF